MAIFMFMTNARKKDMTLNYILYIYYLVCFQKYNNNIEALIESSNKVNIITTIYALKLSFQV